MWRFTVAQRNALMCALGKCLYFLFASDSIHYPAGALPRGLTGFNVHRAFFLSTRVVVLKRPSSASDRLYFCVSYRRNCTEGSLWFPPPHPSTHTLLFFLFFNKHSTSCTLTNRSQTLCFLWTAKSVRSPFC